MAHDISWCHSASFKAAQYTKGKKTTPIKSQREGNSCRVGKPVRHLLVSLAKGWNYTLAPDAFKGKIQDVVHDNTMIESAEH